MVSPFAPATTGADYLYIVWFLVPGAYSRGSTQMLMTADLRSFCTDSRARGKRRGAHDRRDVVRGPKVAIVAQDDEVVGREGTVG